MNELGRIRAARADGYSDGFAGLPSAGWAWDWLDQKENYDQGYQDGAIMRAVRSGDLSRINPTIPRHLTAPRLMLTDDISVTGDDCREFLREAEKRKMKENAFYYLQYYLAMNAPLKIPDIYAEMAREIFGEGSRSRTGRLARPFNPPMHNLPPIPKPKCGQCEGSGVIRGGLGGDSQDEPCPVCDGSGRLP